MADDRRAEIMQYLLEQRYFLSAKQFFLEAYNSDETAYKKMLESIGDQSILPIESGSKKRAHIVAFPQPPRGESKARKPEKETMLEGSEGAKGKRYVCNQCTKSFSTAGNLSRHARIHFGVKHIICAICGASFIRKEDLLAHEVVHTNVKPFACGIDGCDKSFTRSGDLRYHQKTKHAETSGSSPYFSHEDVTDALLRVGNHMSKAELIHGHSHSSSHGHHTHKHHAEGSSTSAASSTRSSHSHPSLMPAAVSTSFHSKSFPKAGILTPAGFTSPRIPGHMHGAGCGHKAVLHDDHIDFILGDGILERLADGEKCNLEDMNIFDPAESMSCDHPHRTDDCLHGTEDCSHDKVMHKDHVDFLVDGELHHMPIKTGEGEADMCTSHGMLQYISDGELASIFSGIEEAPMVPSSYSADFM